MEQIYANMILMTQAVTGSQVSAAAERDTESAESFRDLLERCQGNEPKDVNELEPKSTKPSELSTPVEEKAVVEEDAVQEQIAAATLAAMQNPVIVMTVLEETVKADSMPEQSIVSELPGMATLVIPETDKSTSEPTAVNPDKTSSAEAELPKMEQMAGRTMENVESGSKDQLTDKGRFDSKQPKLDVTDSVHEGDQETPVFRDVKDVMVKVSNVGTAETVEQTTSVKEQILDQVSAALEKGESKLTIQLNPHNLGRVDVELMVAKDGSLQVTLHAENRMTQQLLEKESIGLQSALMRNTQQEVQIEVPRHQESQQQNFEDGRQNHHNHNPQQQREQKQNGSDFLHQLRLGLVPLNAEAS